MTTVHLHAVDDVVRAGLVAQLRGRPDLSLVPDVPADVAIIAADEANDTTLQAARTLYRGGASRLLLVLAKVDTRAVLAAVEAGACGVLRRPDLSAQALADAVRSAHVGGGALPADVLGLLLQQVGVMQRQDVRGGPLPYNRLSERELQVLRLVADGYATAEIARRLCYSERTVKNVIQQVISRLQLRNRAHAVAYAVREGLI